MFDVYICLYIYIIVQFVDSTLGYLDCKFIHICIQNLLLRLIYLNLKHVSTDKWNMSVEYIKTKLTIIEGLK